MWLENMKIVLATQNKHKIDEIQFYLASLRGSEGFEAIPFDGQIELKETGTSLHENARQKAVAVAEATGEWALADDTGLFVTALNGKPGIFSARYAGEKATFQQNTQKLLEEMKNIPTPQRNAYFSCVLALVHPDGREVIVEGKLQGMIATTPTGNDGFGYDPIFFLPEKKCTLAEIPLEEKNKISHRAKALSQMRIVFDNVDKD